MEMTLAMRLVGAGALTMAFGYASPAFAQSSKIAAEALFEEGRRLVTEGNVAEACPKFVDSQRLDPTPGTLLNLANCYDKLTRTASAWATYKEAASLAAAMGRADLLAAARKHADTLAPRLSRLTLLAPASAEGLQIKRDGTLIAPSERGLPIPVDPGRHTIEATAPGKKAWTTAVDVADAGASVSITIPALDDAPPDATPRPAAVLEGSAPERTSNATHAAAPTGGLGAQRVIAVAVAGAGVVGVGIGTGFAIVARSRYKDSLTACSNDDKNLCTDAGVSRRDDARSAGNVATVAFGLGAAAAAVGAALWFLAPSPRTENQAGMHVEFVPTAGGTMVRGRW